MLYSNGAASIVTFNIIIISRKSYLNEGKLLPHKDASMFVCFLIKKVWKFCFYLVSRPMHVYVDLITNYRAETRFCSYDVSNFLNFYFQLLVILLYIFANFYVGIRL